MKRLLSLVIAAIVLLAALMIPASAYGSSYVYDPDNLLSTADEQALESQLSKLNADSAVYYHLVVSTSRSDAFRFSSGDSVVFLIELDEYTNTFYYELFTYGYADSLISDKEADLILDDGEVYDNIKSGNIRRGASRALSLIETAVGGKLRTSNWLVKTIVISLVLAVVIAGIVCGIIIYKYKKKLKSPIYPLDRYARLSLIGADSGDRFINKTLTRVRINTNSGGTSHGGSRGGGSRGRR